jgi:hypothetical protein
MTEPLSDESRIKDFLNALFPQIEPYYLSIWRKSGESFFVQEVGEKEASRIAKVSQTDDVYFGCLLRDRDYGASKRGDEASVVLMPGFWTDADYGNHKSHKRYPPNEQKALELILAMPLEPTFILNTGNGLHAWWLLDEALVLNSETDRIKAKELLRGWHGVAAELWRMKGIEHGESQGWQLDTVCDLPRVMRMPGTYNRKNVHEPRKVEYRLLSDPLCRHNLTEFESHISPPAKQNNGTADMMLNVEAVTRPYRVEPAAEPPPVLFAALYHNSEQFRNTWDRKRPDLKDQSQSGYDQSLADQTVAIGWGRQEVINTLICHRRVGGKEPKPLPYYLRTLEKAASYKESQERARLRQDILCGQPISSDIRNDPKQALALANEILFPDGQRAISRLQKYLAERILYLIEFNGCPPQSIRIDDIMSAHRFANVIADSVGFIIEKRNADKWRHVAQLLLLSAEPIELGSESTTQGLVESLIEGYRALEVKDPARMDWAIRQKRPFFYKDRSNINIQHFHSYISDTGHRVPVTDLPRYFKALGYTRGSISYRPIKGPKDVKCLKVWYRTPEGSSDAPGPQP